MSPIAMVAAQTSGSLRVGAMFVIRPSAMLIRGDLVYEGPPNTFDITSTYTKMLVVGLVGAIGFVACCLPPAGPGLARRAPSLQGPRDIRLQSLVAFLLSTSCVS